MSKISPGSKRQNQLKPAEACIEPFDWEVLVGVDVQRSTN